MKDVFIFLTITTPLICVASYLIVLLERRNKQVKSLMIENSTLKHDVPSRIVDTFELRVKNENLGVKLRGNNASIKIKLSFFDISCKSDSKELDEYELTPQELLNILQKHDEKGFSGYCSKETLEGKRCKDICDKSHCGY
jgi:hypothetical protein